MSTTDTQLRAQFEDQYQPDSYENEEEEAVLISCGQSSC
jgi:hypothetical protein